MDLMREIDFPIDDSLVCDATPAALRDCMSRTKNVLVTLADEYKTTLASLKVDSNAVSKIMLLNAKFQMHLN